MEFMNYRRFIIVPSYISLRLVIYIMLKTYDILNVNNSTLPCFLRVAVETNHVEVINLHRYW